MLLAEAVEMNALCLRSATAIHTVVVGPTPNLPIERRTLYHQSMQLIITAQNGKTSTKQVRKQKVPTNETNDGDVINRIYFILSAERT